MEKARCHAEVASTVAGDNDSVLDLGDGVGGGLTSVDSHLPPRGVCWCGVIPFQRVPSVPTYGRCMSFPPQPFEGRGGGEGVWLRLE